MTEDQLTEYEKWIDEHIHDHDEWHEECKIQSAKDAIDDLEMTKSSG